LIVTLLIFTGLTAWALDQAVVDNRARGDRKARSTAVGVPISLATASAATKIVVGFVEARNPEEPPADDSAPGEGDDMPITQPGGTADIGDAGPNRRCRDEGPCGSEGKAAGHRNTKQPGQDELIPGPTEGQEQGDGGDTGELGGETRPGAGTGTEPGGDPPDGETGRPPEGGGTLDPGPGSGGQARPDGGDPGGGESGEKGAPGDGKGEPAPRPQLELPERS
jgi:hypothetical protein